MGFAQANKTDKGLLGGWARIWRATDLTNGATVEFGFGDSKFSKKYPKLNFSICQMSTNGKNASGKWETDFTDNEVKFIGHAHEKIKKLNIPEKGLPIQILSCEVALTKYKTKDGKNRYAPEYKVYDFDVVDNTGSDSKTTKATAKKENPATNIPDGVDEELPFM